MIDTLLNTTFLFINVSICNRLHLLIVFNAFSKSSLTACLTLSQRHLLLLVSLQLSSHFQILTNKHVCMQLLCNGWKLAEYPYLFLRPSTHHKNNYSQNMNSLALSESRCHQKLKMALQNQVLKFLKMLEFHQLILILHSLL